MAGRTRTGDPVLPRHVRCLCATAMRPACRWRLPGLTWPRGRARTGSGSFRSPGTGAGFAGRRATPELRHRSRRTNPYSPRAAGRDRTGNLHVGNVALSRTSSSRGCRDLAPGGRTVSSSLSPPATDKLSGVVCPSRGSQAGALRPARFAGRGCPIMYDVSGARKRQMQRGPRTPAGSRGPRWAGSCRIRSGGRLCGGRV